MSHFEFDRKAFDGLSLYFQGWQTERDQKGVVCLVHGLGEHSGRYAQWADWLNQAGYSVLSFDLRGHGRSAGEKGHIKSFNEYLNDTDVLLTEAKSRFPNSRYFIYGHSLGAIIVADYVLKRKPDVRGVILSALSIRTALQEQKGKVFLAKFIGSIYPSFSMTSGLVPATISRDPEVVSTYIHDPLVHNKVTAGFGKSSMSAIEYIYQHANEWSLPVLVMHGELDQLGYARGSEEFAGMLKGDCTLKIWPGFYHEVHNEPEKAQVFESVRQWLDQHTKP